jgi:hypothetical protein
MRISVVLTSILLNLAVLSFFLLDYPHRGAAFNSDAQYLPVLLNDLLHRGGSLSDWHLTPSPYFFPDMMVFGLISTVGADAYLNIYTYAIIQTIFCYLAIIALMKNLGLGNYLQVSFAFIIIYIALALFVGRLFQYIFISAHHFSIVIIGILLLSFIIKESKNKNLFLTTAFFLSFGITLSDSLFIVQFGIPFIITSLFYLLVFKSSIYIRDSILIFFGSLLGHLSYPAFVSNIKRYSPDIGPEKILLFISSPVDISKWDLFNIILLLSLLIFIIAGVVALRAKLFSFSGREKLFYITCFGIFSLIINSLVLLLSENIQSVDRYFIPLGIFLSIAIVLFSELFFKNAKVIYFYCVISISTILFNSLYLYYGKNGLSSYEHNAKACLIDIIVSNNLGNGVAAYWDAKKYQAMTNFKTEIAQHSNIGHEYRWITSDIYFNYTPTFVLTSSNLDSLKLNDLKVINGDPDSFYSCGLIDVAIWRGGVILKR